MKKTLLLTFLLVCSSLTFIGCGEKVDTDIKSVNGDKGESVTVTPRTREGEGGGR